MSGYIQLIELRMSAPLNKGTHHGKDNHWAE